MGKGLRLLAVFGALALLLGACSSEEPADVNGGSSDSESVPDEEDGEASTSLLIGAEDFQFSEVELIAAPGENVRLTLNNKGKVAHTFTVDELGIDITADPGQVERVTFDSGDEASYDFKCRFHPGTMSGTLTVGESSSGAESGSTDDTDMDY